MKKTLAIILAFLSLQVSVVKADTEVTRDSVRIYFRQSKIDLDPQLHSNRAALDRITGKLRDEYSDSVFRLRRVEVVGGASPEGSISFNRWLSEQRAATLFRFVSQYAALPDSLMTTTFLGRDWKGLLYLASDDPDLPYREATLDLLRRIASNAGTNRIDGKDALTVLKRFRDGVPYRYMYRKFFPELRSSRMNLWYDKVRNPLLPTPPPAPALPPVHDTVVVHDTVYIYTCPSCRPFYMDISTNMLYDAAAIPNIGVEFYLGRSWSIGANWMYAWWKTDRSHWYWRTYGGDIYVRRWFGKASKEKPLTGHHAGIYAQTLTFDFETGGRGYIGGEPGGSLWDRAMWGGGVEYGYSLPIARRLNLDFTIGIGYLGGRYYEYKPIDNCYVWQATKRLHWFGPTKAEVSLVWLIGCDNWNRPRTKNSSDIK